MRNFVNEISGPDVLTYYPEERLEKEKILFVCTINRMRSATAEKVFENDTRYEVRSAGTAESATVMLTQELLEWADGIVVMERHHRNKIRKDFPEIFKAKPIVCLYIEDHYDFMQKELVHALEDKFEDIVQRGLLEMKKD